VEALDKVAAATERNRSWVIARAVKEYLQNEGDEIIETAEGVAALARGEGVPFAVVMAEADLIIEKENGKRKTR